MNALVAVPATVVVYVLANLGSVVPPASAARVPANPPNVPATARAIVTERAHVKAIGHQQIPIQNKTFVIVQRFARTTVTITENVFVVSASVTLVGRSFPTVLVWRVVRTIVGEMGFVCVMEHACVSRDFLGKTVIKQLVVRLITVQNVCLTKIAVGAQQQQNVKTNSAHKIVPPMIALEIQGILHSLICAQNQDLYRSNRIVLLLLLEQLQVLPCS